MSSMLEEFGWTPVVLGSFGYSEIRKGPVLIAWEDDGGGNVAWAVRETTVHNGDVIFEKMSKNTCGRGPKRFDRLVKWIIGEEA